MTIQKGQDWGRSVARPDKLHLVADDQEAGAYLNQHLSVAGPPLEIAILKSNISRTLGVSGANIQKSEMLRTEFDVVEATFELENSKVRERRYFLGHAFIRSKWFRGETVGVLNSSFVGRRDWAPRSHPNDGKFDVIEFDESISIRQRLTAYRLMRSGSHLPHPKIRHRQMTQYSAGCIESSTLYIESIRVGNVKSCIFNVLPDAVVLYW